MYKFFFIFSLLWFPLFVQAATTNLRISAGDIRFSKETLIAGQTVRLYARIHNVGTTDVSGYVTFFQGSSVLGNSQSLSVIEGGSPEEVYIDFVVPSSAFNIRAEIRGTDPEDLIVDDNTAITAMFEPVLDRDDDSLIDGKDNCALIPNMDQANTDNDTLGDVCDPDDDNDGISDEVEAEIGSNKTIKDTDGDGTPDAKDAFPSDAKQQLLPKKTVEKTFSALIAEVANTISNQESEKITKEIEVEELKEDLTFSPRATFRYSQNRWNTFTFEVVGPIDSSYEYQWQFGDGVVSSKTPVSHIYEQSGAYEVMLSVRNVDNVLTSETLMVFVPFFTLQNRLIVLLISCLTALLFIGGWLLFFFGTKKSHV